MPQSDPANPIKNFAPSWFATVMGTGILAMTSMFYSSYLPFLQYVARGLFYSILPCSVSCLCRASSAESSIVPLRSAI